MTLFLVRHAIAEDGVDDDARPISAKGRRRFQKIVQALAGLDVQLDRVVHSPKLRALQTAELMTPLLREEGTKRPDLPDGLRAWAETRRTELGPSTLSAVDDARFRGLVLALGSVAHPTPDEATGALPRYERRVRKAARGLASVEARAEASGMELSGLLEAPAPRRAHALRRRLRKLRYAREWAGLDTRALAKAQDVFGVLSDETLLVRCALLWQREGGDVPGPFQTDIRRRMLEGLEAARQGWREVEDEVL